MIKSLDLTYCYQIDEEEQEEEKEKQSLSSVKPALSHVSMHVDKGEFVAVLGHNGSGKSTLARHMNALLS
ncbi:MAG: ATP-binding cassette domain-containing protein, partial [Erysipelotrichaceae bacterium]|nr:ATP-binding cassette domain-containing protein [Erysipelotrichaceae bacterium]